MVSGFLYLALWLNSEDEPPIIANAIGLSSYKLMLAVHSDHSCIHKQKSQDNELRNINGYIIMQ